MGKLDDLRAQIDAIDEAILGLLERRAAVAEQAAEAKREAGAASYYDPERERAVLDRLAQKGAGKFPSQAIRPVFREIMSGCLSLQTPITVVFLGPEGGFSHMAARHLFGLAARYREAGTIHGVFDAVRRGDAISGVVPVENSAGGTITHTLDALVDGDLFIRQELVLEASQCLVSRGELSSIERVYAHPLVLAECQLWLARNLPGAQVVQTSSTSSAAREALADERAAAIGTRLAGELFGLSIVAERIQDRAESATRFVIIAREDAPRTGADKTTLAFSLHDAGARGALKRALEIFDEEGINLSRIESRPKGTTPWEYVFLVDVEGHRLDPPVASVIQKLTSRCGSVKLLGSYPRFGFEPHKPDVFRLTSGATSTVGPKARFELGPGSHRTFEPSESELDGSTLASEANRNPCVKKGVQIGRSSGHCWPIGAVMSATSPLARKKRDRSARSLPRRGLGTSPSVQPLQQLAAAHEACQATFAERPSAVRLQALATALRQNLPGRNRGAAHRRLALPRGGFAARLRHQRLGRLAGRGQLRSE